MVASSDFQWLRISSAHRGSITNSIQPPDANCANQCKANDFPLILTSIDHFPLMASAAIMCDSQLRMYRLQQALLSIDQ